MKEANLKIDHQTLHVLIHALSEQKNLSSTGQRALSRLTEADDWFERLSEDGVIEFDMRLGSKKD